MALEGLEVRAEPRDEVEREVRRRLGVHAASLRWEPIHRERIHEHAERGRDVPRMLRWEKLPSLQVGGIGDNLCFRYRGRSCLPVYLDGARVPTNAVDGIPLDLLEAAVVLTPNESPIYQAGAILLFSRSRFR